MTRIYENKGYARRSDISAVVLVVVVIYGFYDLWNAFGGGSSDTTAAMFGVLFVGGGLYGANTIWTEGRDQVLRLDVDFEAGRAALALWRPFRPLVFEGGLDQFTGWRYWVKVGRRNLLTRFVVATVAGYPRPVYIELAPGKDLPEGFRRLAPEVVEEYEESTGRRREAEPEADA
jgi:hypothetical protein